MTASPIITVIYDYTVGFVTDWLKEQADREIKEKTATDSSALDYVAGDLAALEAAVDDYERAYTTARLAARRLSDGESSASRTLRGCMKVQRSPEIRTIEATLRELRKLDAHSETVIAGTIMRAQTQMQIHEDVMEQHLQDRDRLRDIKNPPRPFGRDDVAILSRQSSNQAIGRARMANRYEDGATSVVNTGADIEARISTLMAQLQYLQESMERDRDMFVLLDEGICREYRLPAERTP